MEGNQPKEKNIKGSYYLQVPQYIPLPGAANILHSGADLNMLLPFYYKSKIRVEWGKMGQRGRVGHFVYLLVF